MSEKSLRPPLEIGEEPDEMLEEAVHWLRERKQKIEASLTQQARQIGENLFEQFFGGDITEVTSRNPNKNVSFRKLCERGDLPFTARSLRTFIQVAINFRLLPREKAKALLPSHHSILYQVADPEERVKIGVLAAEENLSARELRKRVKGKGRRRSGAGRKAASDHEKRWKSLVGLAQTLEACIDDEGFLDSACRRDEMVSQAREIRDMLTTMVDRLSGVHTSRKK